MPVLDRIKDRFTNDPKFVTSSDFMLAFECLAFVMVHQEDHQYPAKCIWLSDEQWQQYVALYPNGTDTPTFFGIPVKANKSA
jgi:hypothetical protein